jgi:hypothetical protein
VYDDITLENIILDTTNNVAVLVTDAPAKRGIAVQSVTNGRKHSVLPVEVLSM